MAYKHLFKVNNKDPRKLYMNGVLTSLQKTFNSYLTTVYTFDQFLPNMQNYI